MFLCHGMHYVYDIISTIWCHTHCVYDNTSSISDLRYILSAIISTVYVITPTLSKTSHKLCKTSQVAYVCHRVHYTWHRIHPLRQQALVFMTSHVLNCWNHMHCIWHVIYGVWYPFTICMTSNNACISDITHSMFMTYPLYTASHTVLWQHNHCVISQTLCLMSNPLYLCHHTQ